MADITKCYNDKCKLAKTCYRIQASDDYWQSYSDFKCNEDGTCDHYWEIDPSPIKTKAKKKKGAGRK